MDKIVDSLFVFNQSGTVTNFPGNYSDFRAYVGSTDIALDVDDNVPEPVSAVKQEVVKPVAKSNPQPTREQQKELSRLESKIKQLNEEKEKLQASFLKEGLDADTLVENGKKLDSVKSELEEREMEWLELTDSLEGWNYYKSKLIEIIKFRNDCNEE